MKTPIELSSNAMDERKAKILKIARRLKDFKVISKTDSAITSNGINLRMDDKTMVESINNFGDVSGAILPVLISLTDNKDNGVAIQWKIKGAVKAKQNNERHKIAIEWMKIQSLNKETNKNVDDEKVAWAEKEFEVDKIENVNEHTVNVDFDADVAFFAVRLRIFDENDWSLRSNTMPVKMMNSFKLPNGLQSVLIKGNILKKMMMENVLTDVLKGKRYELLLRGSDHGLSLKAFNDRCKEKGANIVIVASNEYERIFGGYTSISWKKGNPGYQKDEHAFMFYLSQKENKAQRFPVKNAANAIHCNSGYGVCFGGGGDLYWTNNGKSGTCNRSAFDYSAAMDATLLPGGKNGWSVSNYEVWKVI